MRKEALIIIIILLIAIAAVFPKIIGLVIHTPSRVSVDTGIIVVYNNFLGETTNFIYLNDSQLENINNMTLETSRGKIIFSETINLSQDVNDNIVNLDNNINLSYNYIYINTSALTSLDKPAVLYLYNLNFTNPRILRNGEVCSQSICQIINYSGGILIFSVSGFFYYSAEETPVEIYSETREGGGGRNILPSSFTLDKNLIKVTIKQGETQEETLKITNTGNNAINISIEAQSIGRFVAISEDFFNLKPKESKIINLGIFAKDDEKPDVYLGKLIIKGKDIIKIVNIIIEVKERKPLFDIQTSVIDKAVQPNEEVRAKINIKNMGDLEHIDILLYYAIKDFEGNILFFKDESMFIGKEISVTRGIRINELPDGKYAFYSRVSYNNISASSSDVFEVKRIEMPKVNSNAFKIIIIIAFITLVVIILDKIIKKIYSILRNLKFKFRLRFGKKIK